MALQTQPVKSFLKRFLHNVKLCWNYPPSDHPGGPWHHNLYRGGGAQCVCVFVFRQVSAHMHEYAASSYVYWSSGDIPLLLFSVCLCVFQIHSPLLLYSLQIPRGSTLLPFPATPAALHGPSVCEYTFSRELVNVNANTNQHTKTKEHNMLLSARAPTLALFALFSGWSRH